MGAGYHGGFGHTYGAAAGDIVIRSYPYQYFSYISKRKNIDAKGFYDFVAHGEPYAVQYERNGKPEPITVRTASRLILEKADYHRKQPIRLLACSTGSLSDGFAQNLANKLNVVVEAPTKLVWAYPDGRYIVAGRSKTNPNVPNLSDRGVFRKFYPGGNKK